MNVQNSARLKGTHHTPSSCYQTAARKGSKWHLPTLLGQGNDSAIVPSSPLKKNTTHQPTHLYSWLSPTALVFIVPLGYCKSMSLPGVTAILWDPLHSPACPLSWLTSVSGVLSWLPPSSMYNPVYFKSLYQFATLHYRP